MKFVITFKQEKIQKKTSHTSITKRIYYKITYVLLFWINSCNFFSPFFISCNSCVCVFSCLSVSCTVEIKFSFTSPCCVVRYLSKFSLLSTVDNGFNLQLTYLIKPLRWISSHEEDSASLNCLAADDSWLAASKQSPNMKCPLYWISYNAEIRKMIFVITSFINLFTNYIF